MSKVMKKEAPKAGKNKLIPEVTNPYKKDNYLFMGGGFLLVIVGFILMYGPHEGIYSLMRTTIPVLLILGGFAVTGYGIMKKPKEKAE